MSAGIDIKILYLDNDAMEVGLSVRNGRFGGSIEFYATHDVLKTIAATFRGFPKSADDHRELEVGTFDPSFAGGGARFELATSKRGPVIIRAHLRADGTLTTTKEGESVDLELVIEPASIDRFVEALDLMDVAVSATAHLDGAAT